MSDLSSAAANAVTSLNETSQGGFVEEYEIRRGMRRVKRGKPMEQVDAAIKLDAIAARQSSGMFQLAKLRTDR